jgi:hypothetical protein
LRQTGDNDSSIELTPIASSSAVGYRLTAGPT